MSFWPTFNLFRHNLVVNIVKKPLQDLDKGLERRGHFIYLVEMTTAKNLSLSMLKTL